MPKKNKKGKTGRGNVEPISDDESIGDNASVYSIQSDNGGSLDEANNVGSGGGGGSDDGLNSTERYEEKFLQALENATEKSSQTRSQALQTACEILMHRYMPDFIDDRKITIIDVIEKSIKRGKGAEQSWAARLAPLLILQIGVNDVNMIKNLNQFLLVTIQDKSLTFDTRAKCCSSLGLLNFLCSDDIGDLLQIMQIYEQIFSGSYLKGDNTPSTAVADAGTLHCAALSAWGLLLTLIPSGDFVQLITSTQMAPSLTNIIGMLKSPHLDVRMTAGEIIALILECGRAHDNQFLDEYITELIDLTKQLATDSHKYRAKRDRKQQRATFRDVLHYLEEDETPEINIRFGKESLLLDTWAIHHQYNALCTVMGPGMTSHLTINDFLRDIFQLGAKLLPNGPGNPLNKQSKLERHLINAAAFKARTLSRSKNRDKRSAVVN